MASCAPAVRSVLPTQSPTVAVELLSPTSIPTSSPSPTLPPTEAPTQAPTVIPTKEDTTANDYLAKTENSFPLQEVQGLAEFTCTADLTNIDYRVIIASDGSTQISTIFNCEDGGYEFVVPGYLTIKDKSYTPFGLNSTQSNDGRDIQWFGNAMQTHIEKILDVLKAKGKKVKVNILVGANSGSILRYADPYPQIFAGTGWDESVTKFMQTGNPNDLPSVPGLSGRFLPAVRITITNSN